MLSEAELQKKWESLTFTDDFIFSRYTFEYTCKESNHQLKLEDGTIRIFLNTKATELSDLDQKLQAFYHYLQKGVVESDLTQDISNKITTLKNNSIARRTFMTLALKLADARYDGFEEGAYQTKLEMARKFLSMGLSLEQVVQGTSLPLELVQEMAEEKEL